MIQTHLEDSRDGQKQGFDVAVARLIFSVRGAWPVWSR